MSPSDADVLATFRARVNMSADELAAWLDDPESAHAGTGAGLDSGRRILAILRKNPKGDPKGYDEVRAHAGSCFPAPPYLDAHDSAVLCVLLACVRGRAETGRREAHAQGRRVSIPALLHRRTANALARITGTSRATSHKKAT